MESVPYHAENENSSGKRPASPMLPVAVIPIESTITAGYYRKLKVSVINGGHYEQLPGASGFSLTVPATPGTVIGHCGAGQVYVHVAMFNVSETGFPEAALLTV